MAREATEMTGVTPVTSGTLLISVASAAVMDGAVEVTLVLKPRAPLDPAPEAMVMTFVPRLEIVFVMLALTPSVMMRAAITAATPMKMPSAVNMERRRLAHKP